MFIALAAGVLIVLASCSKNNPSAPQTNKTPTSTTSSVNVLHPARAEAVQSGNFGTSPVDLSGTACDSVSTMTSLTLNGVSVPLTGSPPCLDFASQMDTRWGVNIITGTATNRAGAKSRVVQSFLRSPQYSASVSTPASASRNAPSATNEVPSGLYVQMNQELIDDGTRGDFDDLTSLLDAKLAATPLNSLVPTVLQPPPGTHTCSCVFPLPDVTVHYTGYGVTRGAMTGNMYVNYLRAVDGGLAMDVILTNVSAPITVTGYADPGCAVDCVSGEISASASGTVGAGSIGVTGTVDISQSGGVLQVTIPALNVNITDPTLVLDTGPLQPLIGYIDVSSLSATILSTFEKQIKAGLNAMTASLIPQLIGNYLNSFEFPSQVTLPPPMNTILEIGTTFDVIDFHGPYPNGYGDLGFSMSVMPHTYHWPTVHGSVERNGDVPSFDPTQYALGEGLKDDLLNRFLWAAWAGGAFSLQGPSASLGCNIPDAGNLEIEALEPPVVMPGTNGHQIDIGLGDLRLQTDAASQPGGTTPADNIAMDASTIVGATVTLDTSTNKFALTVQDNVTVHLQIYDAPEGADRDALAAQFHPALACMITQILKAVVGAIPVPSPAVGTMGIPGLPANARWVLGDGVLDRADPYYKLTGHVTVK